jgi:hypothetical protein
MYIFIAGSISAFSGCSSLTLQRVEFGWPVEAVVTVSNNNMIEEVRHGFSCRVGDLAVEEFKDSTALYGTKLRLLRSSEGYYFVTGPRFKNVYVFAPGAHELVLRSAINVSETGLQNPALNQRPPYIELLDGDAIHLMLTSDDIAGGKK